MSTDDDLTRVLAEHHKVGVHVTTINGWQQCRCTCGHTYACDFGSPPADCQIDHDEHLAAALAPVLAAREAAVWDEGFKQGGPMHDVDYHDPDAHRRNPYRAEAGGEG